MTAQMSVLKRSCPSTMPVMLPSTPPAAAAINSSVRSRCVIACPQHLLALGVIGDEEELSGPYVCANFGEKPTRVESKQDYEGVTRRLGMGLMDAERQRQPFCGRNEGAEANSMGSGVCELRLLPCNNCIHSVSAERSFVLGVTSRKKKP
jgi:hypothetical protein